MTMFALFRQRRHDVQPGQRFRSRGLKYDVCWEVERVIRFDDEPEHVLLVRVGAACDRKTVSMEILQDPSRYERVSA